MSIRINKPWFIYIKELFPNSHFIWYLYGTQWNSRLGLTLIQDIKCIQCKNIVWKVHAPELQLNKGSLP